MNRLIYESEDPKFKISVDSYQWILKMKNQNSYFPTLSLLLDELVEQMFRGMMPKVEKIEDLDKGIEKVYAFLETLQEVLEKKN